MKKILWIGALIALVVVVVVALAIGSAALSTPPLAAQQAPNQTAPQIRAKAAPTITPTAQITTTTNVNPPGQWLGSSPSLKVRLLPGITYAINVSLMIPPNLAVAGKGGEANLYVRLKNGVQFVDVMMDGTVYGYNGTIDGNSQQCVENAGGIMTNSIPGAPDVFEFLLPCGPAVTPAYPMLFKSITAAGASSTSTTIGCPLKEPREEHPTPELGYLNGTCWVELQFWLPNVPVRIVLFRVPDGKLYRIGPFRGTLVSRPEQPHRRDLPNYAIVSVDEARKSGINIPNDVVPYDPLP